MQHILLWSYDLICIYPQGRKLQLADVKFHHPHAGIPVLMFRGLPESRRGLCTHLPSQVPLGVLKSIYFKTYVKITRACTRVSLLWRITSVVTAGTILQQ